MNNLASLSIMNRQHIEQQHLLTRYLAGQLSDAERDAFEAHYVEHPQVLQELEVAAKLKLGLALLEQSGELTARPRRYWLAGLAAAAVLLVAIAAASWFASPTPTPPLLTASLRTLGDSGAASLAGTFKIERTRSRGVDATIVLPAAPRPIALRVRPELPAATGYGLRLNVFAVDGTPRELGRLDSLQPDADGFLTIYVAAGQLQPGSYEIVVSNAAAATVNGVESSFRILARPAG